MAEPACVSADLRFLVLAPTGRDAALTCTLLAKSGIAALACSNITELCLRAEREGAAGLLIAEEVLVSAAMERLLELLRDQESWSDLPILLFTGELAIARGTPKPLHLSALGNVTLLDRPLKPITMVSAVRAALRARQRQYLARAELLRQQQAVKLRDQFLAMLGHELRNPLAAISLATAAMDSHAPEQRVLKRQTAHLTRLVDDLLDVSRVTTGKATLKCAPLDLVELVRACIHANASAVAAHGVELRFATPETPLSVVGDAVRLEQCVTNLLTNAAKYTPEGGSISVSLRAEADHALLIVEDTGVGIAADMLERVFELFTQAEATLDRAKGGMGIGLTLVKSLIEQHGGAIAAHSAGVGKGSTFSVRLPLSEKTPEERQTAAPVDGYHAKAGCDVLIVEDNEDSRQMLALLLARDGHHVYEAGDGQAGVREALKHNPRALLVDIGLPGMDGYGVARRVREALGPAVFLIALTGYGQPEDKRRALEAGFDAHLTKPVDVKAVQALLSAAVQLNP